MDLGAVGLGGWGVGSNPEAKRRLYGQGPLVDPGGAASGGSEDYFRSSKVAKADDFLSAPDKANGVSNGAPLRSNGSSPVFFSGGDPQQQHMLCFPSPESDVPSPHLSHSSSSLYAKNSGGDVYGTLFWRGPFTPSQYMELEHQALIYKYIVSNVPVPSNLLVPIKKAFESAVVAYHSGGLLRSNAVGWGAFHLGLSRSNDPEPGRCRRTDGKKWRCSKEAVADQKYCEKHMNRGRHRSRKPVEGQTGHSVSAATTTTISSRSPLMGPGSGISNSMNINRMLMAEENLSRRLKDSADIYLLSPTFHLKSKEDPFSISSKQQFLETDPHRSVHQFMNDWPENPSTDPTIASAQPDLQSDRTQLSIAIPTASSPESKKASSFFQLGPLHELDKVEMTDLGVGIGSKQGSRWVPISWEASMGGPLGEALKSTNSSPMGCKTSAASTSPSFESSPTGVLQRTTFVPLSNSSAGSSPRADDSKNAEGA